MQRIICVYIVSPGILWIYETDLTSWRLWEGLVGVGGVGWSGKGCVPVLSPRACPLPGGRSNRKSLLAAWAAPPMLLVGLSLPSARELGVAIVMWEGKWGSGGSEGGWSGWGGGCNGRGKEGWKWWNNCIRKDGIWVCEARYHAKAAWPMKKKTK